MVSKDSQGGNGHRRWITETPERLNGQDLLSDWKCFTVIPFQGVYLASWDTVPQHRGIILFPPVPGM